MLKILMIKLVRFYQVFLSSPGGLFSFAGGRACPQSLSCSEYTILKIKDRGVLKGLLLGVARVLKCNPW